MIIALARRNNALNMKLPKDTKMFQNLLMKFSYANSNNVRTLITSTLQQIQYIYYTKYITILNILM